MEINLQKGNANELRIMLKFMEMGYCCSIPYGNQNKYDFIVDINNKLYRIQCKPAQWCSYTVEEKTAFKVNTSSVTFNRHSIKRHCYTKEQIDLFACYFNGKFYLIPIEDVGKRTIFTLRYVYPHSNQKSKIHLASKYEFEEQIKNLL